jgi:hypothetical protein
VPKIIFTFLASARLNVSLPIGSPLHVRGSLLGEVPASEVFVFVLDVVVEQEVIVRVERRAALDHQIENLVGQSVAVLDRRATRQHGRARCWDD